MKRLAIGTRAIWHPQSGVPHPIIIIGYTPKGYRILSAGRITRTATANIRVSPGSKLKPGR
jgi:hypothetical protein